jgi:hypothetical protein
MPKLKVLGIDDVVGERRLISRVVRSTWVAGLGAFAHVKDDLCLPAA